MNMESFEDIKVLMDNFDPAALLPDLTSVVGVVAFITRIALLAGPIILLVTGLGYLYLAPKEANHSFGYRCYFGMGSVEAWQFTQKMAGLIWGGLGAALSLVMLLVTGGFGSKDIMEIIGTGFTCMIWELVLVGISVLAINGLAMAFFDHQGHRRR